MGRIQSNPQLTTSSFRGHHPRALDADDKLTKTVELLLTPASAPDSSRKQIQTYPICSGYKIAVRYGIEGLIFLVRYSLHPTSNRATYRATGLALPVYR